jgi:hypothetical protein
MKRNPWWEELERTMPSRADAVARNHAITARYAGWYLTEPRFKWAAMAAFASYQAGQVLALKYGDARDARALARLGRRGATALLGNAIELVREVNVAVFDDVGWAHHAFVVTGGDASAIARELADRPSHRDLVRGFAELASARLLEEDEGGGGGAARFAVWEGARLILRHEQALTVQPRFARLDAAFRAYLTLLSVTPFQQLAQGPVRDAWFLPHALRRLAATRRRADVPDMTRFEQRWPWIEQEALPLFREVESRGDPRMRAVMERMASLPRSSAARAPQSVPAVVEVGQ